MAIGAPFVTFGVPLGRLCGVTGLYLSPLGFHWGAFVGHWGSLCEHFSSLSFLGVIEGHWGSLWFF